MITVTNIYSFTLAMFILFFLYLKDDLNYVLTHILHNQNAQKVSLQFLTGMDVHNHSRLKKTCLVLIDFG